MKLAPLFGFCLSVWSCLSVSAKDLPAYRVGDVAAEDVVTPMALEVVDAAATTALQSAKARQYPAVFRSWTDATNVMAGDFLSAFARTRTNFLAELSGEFHASTLDEAAVASADFGRLVTVFGVKHKDFPITDDLAAEWALGHDGLAIREKLLAELQWAASRPVRPDEALPKGLVMAENIRLVPVADPGEKLSFERVQQGWLAPSASLLTVSNAQAIFRLEFPAEKQLFARALGGFIQPNCFPDAPLTQLSRGAAVYQLVVSDHYDAGDAIVRQGMAIDEKTRAALAALSEKLASHPAAVTAGSLPPPRPPSAIAVTPVQPRAPAPVSAPISASIPVSPSAPSAKPAPVAARSEAAAAPASRPGLRHFWVIAILAGISAVSLVVAGGLFLRERGRLGKAAAAQAPLPFPEGGQPNPAPQVAQAVREAVQQELAMQRRELLVAQQAAAQEIATLVRRLDELQVPMQERLRTYEARIQTLEKELALRNEENRELLRLKIEMVNRQLEAERAAGSSITPFSA